MVSSVKYVQLKFVAGLAALAVAVGVCHLSGCGPAEPAVYRFNAVQWLKQERLFLSQGEHFNEGYQTEIGSLLTAVFGTPDQPLIPALLGEKDPINDVVTSQHVDLAAGPVRADQSAGLFRRYCAHCHGITGDGGGPSAAYLNPYPRDFRMGKFKYKSTPLRSVPTDANLTETLINGVPGTPMPSFATLPEQEIAALVDYVKFLAMRGQYERYLMEELSNLDSGEPLVRIELADRYRQLAAIEVRDSDQSREFDDIQERYLDSMFSRVGELLDDSVSRWVDAEDDVTEIPDAPAAFSSGHPEHASFLKRGRELFHKKGNCAQCHGETGVGNGQIDSFDDWSNDWIKTPGVNPFNPQTFQEFTQAGALSPRPARPRNLTEAIYRGGGQPEKIYLRIANGIEGTPMPAAPALKPQEIWALVAFVKYLPYNDVDALDAMK